MDDGGENAHNRAIRAGAHVCYLDPQGDRAAAPTRFPGTARMGGNPGERQIVDVVTGPLPVRSILPVTGERTIDYARIHLPQRLIPHPEPFHDSRTELLENNVEVVDQPADDLHGPRLFQVKGQRTL